MKKNTIIIIIAVLVVIAVVVGAILIINNSKVELDINKVTETLTNLKQKTYSQRLAAQNLSSKTEILGELDYIYDFDLAKFGIDKEKLNEVEGQKELYFYKENKENGNSFVVFKAKEGQKDALIKEFDKYYEAQKSKLLKQELNGYMVYIVSNDNEAAMKVLKEQGYEDVFGAMMKADDSSLELIGLKKEDISEYTIGLPAFIVSSKTYMVVKPVDGKQDVVKAAIDAYFVKEEQKWSTYLPNQHELMKNRLITTLGDYLVYVVSEDNQLVLETIKNCKK